MGRFDGMKGLVLGVANDHSIAWAIAKEVLAEGGQIGFSHLPDRPDDARQRNRRRVAQLTDPEPGAKFLMPMDVSDDAQIAAVIDENYIVEGALRRQVQQNITRLKDIACYRGMRHRRGLPVRGQNTRTNARTRKGPARTVAKKKK